MPVHGTSPFPGSPMVSSRRTTAGLWTRLWRWGGPLAVTTTLKLGTGITLVPERNPLLLAKEIATLDYYSGGRFLFGIGAGWHKEETAIMGGDFAHRWTQTREAVEAMQQLWAHDAAEYHGRF